MFCHGIWFFAGTKKSKTVFEAESTVENVSSTLLPMKSSPQSSGALCAYDLGVAGTSSGQVHGLFLSSSVTGVLSAHVQYTCIAIKWRHGYTDVKTLKGTFSVMCMQP